jgi:hypothetical protein
MEGISEAFAATNRSTWVLWYVSIESHKNDDAVRQAIKRASHLASLVIMSKEFHLKNGFSYD